MSHSLPPELRDLIIDHLHDEPTTLETCCFVSKSWIQRARKHIFADITFKDSCPHVERWKRTFPDPTNSPAHHTRTLSIYNLRFTPAEADILPTFCGVVHLNVNTTWWRDSMVSFVPLRGLSPVLRSLRLTLAFILPASEVFGLICSFPLLEDLALVSQGYGHMDEGWSAPSTSPRFTGSLEFRMAEGMQSTTRRLLGLPNGLHFTSIVVSWLSEKDIGSTMDLVSRCSDTLQSLSITDKSSDVPGTTGLDLSKVKRLQDVVFHCGRPNVKWIGKVLRTAEPRILRHVLLELPRHLGTGDAIWEPVRQEWLELDCLLVQFWTSHSLRSTVMYGPGEGGKDLRDLVARLLPELTRGGIFDLVEDRASLM